MGLIKEVWVGRVGEVVKGPMFQVMCKERNFQGHSSQIGGNLEVPLPEPTRLTL